MKLVPMLAGKIDPKKIVDYCTNEHYWIEQKYDGVRLLVHIEDGKAVAYNRKGDITVPDPRVTASFLETEGEWVLDGEWVNSKFVVFDMPIAMDQITPDMPLYERRNGLEAVFHLAWGGNPYMELAATARTEDEKYETVQWTLDQQSEGVMIKHRDAAYHPGKRSPAWMKGKYTATADCVLLEIRREGKASCSVGLFKDGQLIEVTSVKMTEKQLVLAKSGDVVEVRYLYATADDRLYQPVFLAFRPDKNATECTLDQLHYTDKKTVRTHERQR